MTVVVVYGDDDFLVEQQVQQEAASYMASSIRSYQFPEGFSEFEQEVNTESIDGKSRVFVIFDSEFIPSIPKHETVIFSSSKKMTGVPDDATIINCKKLKSFSNNNEVIKWILKTGDQLGVDLTRVAGALFLNNGNDLRKIYSEIEKIVVLSNPGDVISPDVAKSVMCFSSDLDPKFVIESICEGNTLKALTFYERLQERNDETGWIIAYLQRYTSNQLRFNVLSKSGASNEFISEVIGLHPYVIKQTLQEHKKTFKNDVLCASFLSLCDLDSLHKLGKNVRFLLELEIVRLSEEANVDRI
jgi:DNA polymerase III delta subunit